MLATRFTAALLVMLTSVAYLISAGCQTEKKVVEPTLPPTVVKTDTILFCRDTSENNKTLVESLAKNGWHYAGQLHNDGINCSMVLWVCYDAKAACAIDLNKK